MAFSKEIESLILEAKAVGKDWKRTQQLSTNTRQVRCANGRCVLGAVIHARGIQEPLNEDGESELYGNMDFPDPDDAVRMLGIPYSDAELLINANDGLDEFHAALLDQLLGITEEVK